MKQYITYGMDNMGALHIFKGRKKIYKTGAYMFVDGKNRKADVYIQNEDDVNAFKESTGTDISIGEHEIKEDIMDYGTLFDKDKMIQKHLRR
jgi:hypothetical protein